MCKNYKDFLKKELILQQRKAARNMEYYQETGMQKYLNAHEKADYMAEALSAAIQEQGYTDKAYEVVNRHMGNLYRLSEEYIHIFPVEEAYEKLQTEIGKSIFGVVI